MGIFESLKQAAGINGGATQGSGSGIVGAVIQMVQSQPGGIGGVIQQFQTAGLGGLTSSWLSGGANQAVSPQQVQSALGSGPVGQIAEQLGVSHEQAAGHLAQLLPMIIDHLSPNGTAPTGGGTTELGDLLARFTGR